MREIKFRCWSNVDGWCGAYSVHQSGLVRFGDTEPIWQTPEEAGVILLQYTGLKDKNGKEIYEGDIVKSVYETGDEATGKVIFKRGSFSVAFYHSAFGREVYHPFSFCKKDGFEVIGNIYENPELLTNN